MGLSPADIRALSLGEFLALAEAVEEAHTPADKRGPPRPSDAQLAALRRAEGKGDR